MEYDFYIWLHKSLFSHSLNFCILAKWKSHGAWLIWMWPSIMEQCNLDHHRQTDSYAARDLYFGFWQALFQRAEAWIYKYIFVSYKKNSTWLWQDFEIGQTVQKTILKVCWTNYFDIKDHLFEVLLTFQNWTGRNSLRNSGLLIKNRKDRGLKQG